jgi:hypothetical protein
MKKAIKAICFTLVLTLVFGLFTWYSENYSFTERYAESNSKYRNIYDMPEDTVDIIFFSTSIYRAILPSYLYLLNGNTSFNLFVDQMPVSLIKPVLEHFLVEKQSPKLIVVDLSFAQRDPDIINQLHVRYTIEGLPFNIRYKILKDILPYYENAPKIQSVDVFSYLFPTLYEHNNYSNAVLGGKSYDSNAEINFMGNYKDLYWETKKFASVPALNDYSPSPISDNALEILDELLDYAKTQEFELLFTMLPKTGIKGSGGKIDKTEMQQNKWLYDYVTNKGFTVLNLFADGYLDETGINPEKDFADERHLNMKGSAKFTYWLATYLNENYDIKDHRDDDEYFDWLEMGFDFYEVCESHNLILNLDLD